MPEDVCAILDNDVGYHSYALRDVITDFAERFGREALETALKETLPQFKMEVINYAEHSALSRIAA